MYKVDIENKKLLPLTQAKFSELGLLERFDLQEWIEQSPAILGEDLLIIAKELFLPSGIRLDLLAIDKTANLVIIEIKRDDSGSNIDWQAIKYASECSKFTAEKIYADFGKYLHSNSDDAQERIEKFVDLDEEEIIQQLNDHQKIILVASTFRPDVASAVLWLRDHEVDIQCVRLRPYLNSVGELFITPDKIIPLPEAKDYIEQKERKQKEAKSSTFSRHSTSIGTYDLSELEEKLRVTLASPGKRIPWLIAVLEILLSEPRNFTRNEIKDYLIDTGVADDLTEAGKRLNKVSQLLTLASQNDPLKNDHLRQVVRWDSEHDNPGAQKDNYRIEPEYSDLIKQLIREYFEREEEET